jgi:hypothetical protein
MIRRMLQSMSLRCSPRFALQPRAASYDVTVPSSLKLQSTSLTAALKHMLYAG